MASAVLQMVLAEGANEARFDHPNAQDEEDWMLVQHSWALA